MSHRMAAGRTPAGDRPWSTVRLRRWTAIGIGRRAGLSTPAPRLRTLPQPQTIPDRASLDRPVRLCPIFLIDPPHRGTGINLMRVRHRPSATMAQHGTRTSVAKAFPGKVDTGFPQGMRQTQGTKALPDRRPCRRWSAMSGTALARHADRPRRKPQRAPDTVMHVRPAGLQGGVGEGRQQLRRQPPRAPQCREPIKCA
jgi:hypothetical protein